MAIYKHGGGPELQTTEKNQRGDFLQALYMRTHLLEILVLGNKYSKITLALQLCRVQFFFKVPSSLDVCVSYIKKSTQTEMCQFLS